LSAKLHAYSLIVYISKNRRLVELIELPVNAGKNNLSINVNDFIEGVYFISVTDGQLISTKKFVVE